MYFKKANPIVYSHYQDEMLPVYIFVKINEFDYSTTGFMIFRPSGAGTFEIEIWQADQTAGTTVTSEIVAGAAAATRSAMSSA
jgi:hypothetical protein